MELGKTIKSIRKKMSMSLAELSELSGVSSTTLTRIENGQRLPHSSIVRKIANGLNVPEPILYLLSIEDGDISNKTAYKMLYPTIKQMLYTMSDIESSWFKGVPAKNYFKKTISK
jgi:transcriptional regulator with XRE-family HTH domain